MIKMTVIGIYLTLTSLMHLCLAVPNIHKQMSTEQLRSIFHVENADFVPNYELIQLYHHGTIHHQPSSIHNIRKRNINNNNNNFVNINNNNNNSDDSNNSNNQIKSHHIKKDLSKTSYYSELKLNLTKNILKDDNLNNDYINIQNNYDNDQKYSDLIKKIDLNKIKEHNVSLSAFGEIYNLTLKPTDGLFKNGPQSLRMWTAESEPNITQGIRYDEIIQNTTNENEYIGEIFQDEQNMAAILMRRQLETGDLVMEGSIGHDIVIKPLPHELSPNKDQTHHVIYKRDTDAMDQFSDFALMEPDEDVNENEDNENNHRRVRRAARNHKVRKSVRVVPRFGATGRGRRAVPYTIYPEILVIVDYDGYRLHGGDNVQVKRYFVSFWNGVDLRYRLLKGPRIHISIAGIIISRGRDATPYLERNRVGRDAIDSAAALTDMGKYLFRERRLPVYDIAVAITKLDLCKRSYAFGECKRGTAGFAYVGGACVVNKRLEKVNSVAIIEDTGGFSGIIVAAHEVGHLLGAVHDGSPPPSYLGGPGAAACRWEDGYIMSDLRHTERGFRWSPCTIQSFHHFLNGDTASCLHNTPHEDHSLGRQLPGTLLSLDAQCRRDRGTYACFKDDRVCAQLFCFDSSTGYCVAYRPAAEGSSCGNGLHCLDGRCVPQHSNLIHSYRPVYQPSDDDPDNENDDDIDVDIKGLNGETTDFDSQNHQNNNNNNNPNNNNNKNAGTYFRS